MLSKSRNEVASIGVDNVVNQLSLEELQHVMEELTDHQKPEKEKCPLVRHLNASNSGYFKSTGDVVDTDIALGGSSLAVGGDLSGACGSGNSIEMVEYRRTFEVTKYRSSMNNCSNNTNSNSNDDDNNNRSRNDDNNNCTNSNNNGFSTSNSNNNNINSSDIKLKSTEKANVSSISVSSTSPSSTNTISNNSTNTEENINATCDDITISFPSSNLSKKGSGSVDSFVNFDTLKRSPNQTIQDDKRLKKSLTQDYEVNESGCNRSSGTTLADFSEYNYMVSNAMAANHSTGNSDLSRSFPLATHQRPASSSTVSSTSKPEKRKNRKKPVETYARDIDGHIGDQSIDVLLSYVIGDKPETSGSSSDSKLTSNSRNAKDSSSNGKVKKKEKSSVNNSRNSSTTNNNNQGRNKKGTSNTSTTNRNNVNCASTNGSGSDNEVKSSDNADKSSYSVDSGLGKSIPRSFSATTFDSKLSPSELAQKDTSSELGSSSLTSPVLSKSHSIESSISSNQQHSTKNGNATSLKQHRDKTNVIGSKDSSVVSRKSSRPNDGYARPTSGTTSTQTIASTAIGGDLESNYQELRYAASDSEMADQEMNFQTVKSKHLKRRKGVGRRSDNRGSPLPRSAHIFASTTNNTTSSTSTTPSVTSSTSNSVNTSATARGYESEREYCADEYRRRKEYQSHRKIATSMPHSEQNSAENSDIESYCSYPVSGRMSILPTPPRPPVSSISSSTPKVSYADIAKMGSVMGAVPVVGTLGLTKGPTPTQPSSSSVSSSSVSVSTSSLHPNATDHSPKSISSSSSSSSQLTNLQTTSTSNNSTSSGPLTSISSTNYSPSSLSPSGPSNNQTLTDLSPSSAKAKNNQVKLVEPTTSTSVTSATSTSIPNDAINKESPPLIKSEIITDQKENSFEDNQPSNTSHQCTFAAIIRPKELDTNKKAESKIETKVNEEIIHKKEAARADKNFAILSSSSSISSSPSTTSTLSNTASSSTSVTIAKTANTSTTNSKTLEALISPPVEKTSTFDMKKANNNSFTNSNNNNINNNNVNDNDNNSKPCEMRVASSTKSDNTSSRASVLRKSNSIPGASVKRDPHWASLNGSNTSSSSSSYTSPSRSKLLSSLPPVIMNDDSNATDEIESSFTFGFFDDVKSSNSISKTISTKFTASSASSSSVSIEQQQLKPRQNTVLTKQPVAAKTTVPAAATLNKIFNSTNQASSSSPSSTRVFNVKSTGNTTSTNSTITIGSIAKETSKSSEVIHQVPQQGKKVIDKDSKPTSGSTSLEKFIPIKLAEPLTTMDVDINTFNYNQIINFIKTAWDSVLRQYHRSPETSHGPSKGTNLFSENTTYYHKLIHP